MTRSRPQGASSGRASEPLLPWRSSTLRFPVRRAKPTANSCPVRSWCAQGRSRIPWPGSRPATGWPCVGGVSVSEIGIAGRNLDVPNRAIRADAELPEMRWRGPVARAAFRENIPVRQRRSRSVGVIVHCAADFRDRSRCPCIACDVVDVIDAG